MKYKKKSIWVIALTLLITILLVGCAAGLGTADSSDETTPSENNNLIDRSEDDGDTSQISKDESSFKAIVNDMIEGSVAVMPFETEPISKSYAIINFDTGILDDIDVSFGDIVSVTYTGDIEETAGTNEAIPTAQINAVDWSIYEQSRPTGMSAVETIQYYYEKMNEKDEAAVRSLYYNQNLRAAYFGFDELISIELLSCEEGTYVEDSLGGYPGDPYEVAKVRVTYDVKYSGGVGPTEEDGTHIYGHTLVKPDENSDWVIVENGVA